MAREALSWLGAKLSSVTYTTIAFCVAISALPALALSYVVVRITKNVWLRILSSRYPHLEFIKADTVRSLLDTHRNQGIINVLLCVKGPFNPDLIRQKLQDHVLEKRDKFGGYQFPRMREALVSCWGNYAWDPAVPFRLENHFMISNGVFRGRPITENNIQEYVSDVVSKYFTVEIPPWQYIVIPCVNNDAKYYILIRVHHLLLTGKKSINIGDMLMIDQSTEMERAAQSIHDGRLTSSLSRLFPAPSAIPDLIEKIGESVSNAWNEFISEYDPVESPRALKTLPGAFHCASLVLIALTAALREVSKRRSSENTRTDAASAARLLLTSLRYECKRRNLTITKILISPLVTGDPRKWPFLVVNVSVKALKLAATWPLRLRDELNAIKSLRETGHVSNPGTFTWRYAGVILLGVAAAKEAWTGALAAWQAPARLWHDAARAHATAPLHALQTANLCGRKVAAWSRAVPREYFDRLAQAHNVSTTDIALYACAKAVLGYFENVQAPPPSALLCTARAHTEDFLFAFSEGDGKNYKKSQTGGMVCLALPLDGTPKDTRKIVERACFRQGAIAGAWAAQARCGAVTRALPSPAARLALNVLSRKYAVSYAEINAVPNARKRSTLWGHMLEHIVYWRPPQANISMSLTVIQYANTVQLTVMTDARLSPGHTVPAIRFPTIIEDMISQLPNTTPDITFQPIEPVTDTVSSEKDKPLPTKPTVISRSQSVETRSRKKVEMGSKAESSHNLRPPPSRDVLSPPMKRRISHE